MQKLYHLVLLRIAQFFQRQKWSLLSLSALVFLSSLPFLASPVYGVQKHGCALGTPPPVSGTPITAPSTPGSVVINEVLSQPDSTWNCSEAPGVFSVAKDSWIELYNTQNQAFNLYAAHAEISLDGGSTWYHLPFGSAIDAKQFLVVYPEEEFLASSVQWTIVLAIGSTVVDQAIVPALEPDQSYARTTDGSSSWQFVGLPTIDASNNGSNQPATPTPTQTPQPLPTVKPTRTPGSGTVGSGGAGTPGSSGTQPAWGGVQFPPGSTPVPTSEVSATSPPYRAQPGAAPAQNNGQGTWLVVTVVLGSLLLLGALFWRRRLFRRAV